MNKLVYIKVMLNILSHGFSFKMMNELWRFVKRLKMINKLWQLVKTMAQDFELSANFV